jgi:hypothetical protein
MALNSPSVINTREDLDAAIGTPAHTEFIDRLIGSMTRTENQAEYPDGYGQPTYDGPKIEPKWVEVEDLSAIERFGFTKSEILALK